MSDDLRELSSDALRDLYWKREQERREPQLRKEERKLGAKDWETASYYTLLTRSIDRFNESRRPADLRKAQRLGIPNPDALTTDTLRWAVFDAEMRERRIRELSPPAIAAPLRWWKRSGRARA